VVEVVGEVDIESEEEVGPEVVEVVVPGMEDTRDFVGDFGEIAEQVSVVAGNIMECLPIVG
jgi:hypothetical protein